MISSNDFSTRFTSAIRTSFQFSGKERFHFAGGESLWVYINKQLVLHIISSNSKTFVDCKTFELKNAKGNNDLSYSFLTIRVGIQTKNAKQATIEMQIFLASICSGPTVSFVARGIQISC